jgi:hypothetical protein
VRAASLGYQTLLTPDVSHMLAPGPALAVAATAADALRDQVARLSSEIRWRAAGREIEFAMNLFAVGDEIPPYAKQATGADAELLT